MADPITVEVSNRFVVTDFGGFPVDNIAYWKMSRQYDLRHADEPVLVVWFKTGGFIEMPGVSAEQLASLVYGVPY